MISSVRIILKSGKEFTVKCEKFVVSENIGGGLAGYEIDGIIENRPVYLDVSDVSAVVDVLSDEEGTIVVNG